MFLRQTWNDSRLVYDKLPNLRSLELDTRLMDKIWVPDLFISNEKTAHFHTVTVPNKLMHIYPEGRVHYSMRYIFTCCNISNPVKSSNKQKAYVNKDTTYNCIVMYKDRNWSILNKTKQQYRVNIQ